MATRLRLRLDSPPSLKQKKSSSHNKKKPNTTHFNIYIRNVTKQIHPNLQLQTEVVET